MIEYCAGPRSGGVVVVGAGVRVCVLAMLIVVGGCASRQAQQQASPRVDGAHQMARVAGYRQEAAPVVIEDDGIVGQSPPRSRRRVEPDDPSEPFSPNYGVERSHLPLNSSDAAGDVAPARESDAYDPFLDGPQWDAYKDADTVGFADQAREDEAARERAPRVVPQMLFTATGLRPGFRRKRPGQQPSYVHRGRM